MFSGFMHMCVWLCVGHTSWLKSGDSGHRHTKRDSNEARKRQGLRLLAFGRMGRSLWLGETDPSQELGLDAAEDLRAGELGRRCLPPVSPQQGPWPCSNLG